MAGTIYKSILLIFKSIGLAAREALDRCPPNSYLNMDGCLERAEESVSSRFGSIIINRDPAGIGTANYLFPAAPVTLTRLKALNGSVYRYAALSDGSLWRRATDTQGPYTQILSPGTLSGLPFTSIVTTMYESATPYILLFDSKYMCKDNGTLPAPQRLGIYAPLLPAISAAYAPVTLLLADFSQVYSVTVGDAVTNSTTTVTSATANFTPANIGDYLYGTNIPAGATIATVPNSTTITMSLAATGSHSGGDLTFTNYMDGGGLTVTTSGLTFNTITAGFYGPQLGGDHYAYTWGTLPPPVPMPVPDGALVFSANTLQTGVKFGSDSYNQTFQYVSPSTLYSPTDSFAFRGATVNVPSSSTGTFTYEFPSSLNLSLYDPADLIVIIMRVVTPANVSSISLSFDAAGSNYTSSYYTKTIIPVSYQGFITDPLTTDAITALTDQVLIDSLTNPSSQSNSGFNISTTATTSTLPDSSTAPNTFFGIPITANSTAANQSQLNPASLASNSAWSTIYLQKGDFLPVGNAGQPGLDWTVITGFQLSITTNTSGDTNVDLNSLYFQGDPTSTGVGTNAGPSSYAGVGYDLRYIYKDSSTGTPSNPSAQQLFSTTPLNPGASSTLVVLRQAIDMVGQYSSDTQADLVQIYVRGGLYGDTWRYVDQIPNLPLTLPVESLAYVSVVTTITGYNIIFTTLTVNVFQAGTPITFSGLTAQPQFNGQTLYIDSTPSPSQIVFSYITPPVPNEDITFISIAVSSTSRGPLIIITLTVTPTNRYSTGTSVVLSGLTTLPVLNGYTALVSSTPTTTEFQFEYYSEAITYLSFVQDGGSGENSLFTFTTAAANTYTIGSRVVLNGIGVVGGFEFDRYNFGLYLNGTTVTITALPAPNQLSFQMIFNIGYNVNGASTGTITPVSLASNLATTAETGMVTAASAPLPATTTPETGTITPALSSFPGAGLFNYRYILPDTALQQGQILNTANDVPVTSSLQVPVNTTLSVAVVLQASPNINYPIYSTVTVAAATAVFVVNQIITVGTPSDLEQVLVEIGGVGKFTGWFQLAHAIGEPVQAFSTPGQPCPLSAIAYNTNWWAGDPNNPHYLYYANPSYPENIGPGNYIPCGTPADPITLVINKRGTLFVSTLSTWYQIYPGNPPYAQSTGSKHGAVASYGWGDAEGEIIYEASDGIRTFRGSDGAYMTLPIEWLWRDNNLTPVELIDTTQLSKVLGAYVNTDATFVYIGQDGHPHRLIWSTTYKRWRNDDVPVTAQYVESDTNTLVYAKPMTIGGVSGWAIVYDSYSQSYDDGGWVDGSLVQLPIPIDLQTPYMDMGTPNNQKQFNTLTIDADPNGQTLTPTLLFDGMNGDPTTLATQPPTFTGSGRDKFDFQINSGLGQQAYQLSLQITGDVTAAPIIYQAEIYAAVLADQRSSYDTYWITLNNTNETKLVKQCFIDYTTMEGVSLTLAVYHDGQTVPYFTIGLPTNTARLNVPVRVRFPAQILRLFRLVITANVAGGEFQLWSPVSLEWKMYSTGSGFQRLDLGDTTP